jgi:predicted nucleic acid-binding protein
VRALERISISVLARVEVPAAFWRKRRTGEVRGDDAALLAADFAADVKGTDGAAPRFAVVTLDNAILTGAARLVGRHPLRGYDAVQLATALAVLEAEPSTRFVSFDAALNEAAAAEGLQVL